MFNLPERTLCNKKIPKSKFYEKLEAGTKLKNLFIAQIDQVIWKHKLSKETINLEPAGDIAEIQIFELYVKQREFSKDILESIDKFIPYPILHVLIYNNEVKFAMAYKLKNQNNENRSIVQVYYESEWKPISRASMTLISGLDLKAVYENIIRNLMSIKPLNQEKLEETVARQAQIEAIDKEIRKLEAKIKNEKQFNIKVSLNIELQKKLKEVDRLQKFL